MIEDILEFTNETAVKESKHKHPTLKQVRKQMQGFDEALVMYVYHQLNGRFDEASTYLQEWDEEQEELHTSFKKRNELNENQLVNVDLTDEKFDENKINSQDNIHDDSNSQHTTPDATNNIA
jgi:hypothetical protein